MARLTTALALTLVAGCRPPNYGYVIAARGGDGQLTFTSYDYASREIVDQFTITAAGTAP